METKFKLSDSVLARICQLLQEAIIFGFDITDLMREIELVTSTEPGEENLLVMTQEYAQKVADNHMKALKRAQELQNAAGSSQDQVKPTIILS